MALSATIRILVVDDHTLFRRGLMALLSREPQFEVVGDAADAGEAQRRAQELQPDLILLDNHLPGVRGVDALPSLREAAPSSRVLMLTVSEDEQDLADALKAGAAGYLLKTIEGDALAAAIRRVMAGESVLAQEMTSKLVAAFQGASNGMRPATATVSAPPRQAPRCWTACRRANATSCAASHAAPATRKSAANWASPRPQSRSTCSTCCANST